jgi:hypothetical protein
VKRTTIGIATILAVVAGACSPTSFDSAGDRSTGWIGDVPPTEVTVSTLFSISTLAAVESFELTSAGGLTWVNDSMPSVVDGGDSLDSSQVVSRIWSASTGVDAFVQASRADMAMAIPGIRFPGAVPAGVEQVTSQLVFNPSGGALGDPWFAAFGLWKVEPYSQARETGQAGVLLIGPNPTPDTEPPTLLCEVIRIADALTCDEVDVGDTRGALATVDGGVRLQWDSGNFRYQLFYRDPPEPALPMLVAQSLVDLASLESDAFDAYREVATQAQPTN